MQIRIEVTPDENAWIVPLRYLFFFNPVEIMKHERDSFFANRSGQMKNDDDLVHHLRTELVIPFW